MLRTVYRKIFATGLGDQKFALGICDEGFNAYMK
jgi:hypothetical protein